MAILGKEKQKKVLALADWLHVKVTQHCTRKTVVFNLSLHGDLDGFLSA